MCKLVIGINKTNKKNNNFETLIKAQENDLRKETDGIGSIMIDDKNNLRVFRELSEYGKVFHNTYNLLSKAKLVAIHTRNRTSGKIDLANVHFFEIDGYLMAHNGFVGAYHNTLYSPSYSYYGRNKAIPIYNKEENDIESGSERKIAEDFMLTCDGCFNSKKGFCKKHKTEYYHYQQVFSNKKENKNEVDGDFSDSYLFLKNIEKPITIENLTKEVEDKRFTGFGIILNKNNNEIFLIVKKEVNLRIDKNGLTGAFGSYKLENEYKDYKLSSFCGIEYIQSAKTEKIDFENHIIPEGIYKLKI